MIPLVAVLVALACAAASARRVWFAANATALHPEDVNARAREGAGRARRVEALRALVAKVPAADWERDLLEALRRAPGACAPRS